jgi:hypothetical protein
VATKGAEDGSGLAGEHRAKDDFKTHLM